MCKTISIICFVVPNSTMHYVFVKPTIYRLIIPKLLLSVENVISAKKIFPFQFNQVCYAKFSFNVLMLVL